MFIVTSLFLTLLLILTAFGSEEQAASGETTVSTRYLLYDVNPPEGFNLRRDVYMRMANMVKLMRKHDARWVLVLPPFSNLYHWKSVIDQEKVSWSAFFDVPSLNKHVPVVEFSEFLTLIKQDSTNNDSTVFPVIDEYYQLQQDKEFFKTGVWKEGVSPSNCVEDPEIRLIHGVYRGLFYGFTELAAVKFDCLTTSADIEVFSKWISSATQAKVVMLGRAEVIIHGKYSEWSEEWWTARRSMRYSKELVKLADNYRAEFLKSDDEHDKTVMLEDWQITEKQLGSAIGGPYICAHWRRADYVAAYPNKSPGPSATARQLKKFLTTLGLSDVFVSTDTYDHEVLRLTKLLEPDNIRVFRFKVDRPTLLKIRDGGVAIVDQLICSHARLFVGSYQSTFSYRIQEDRSLMGFGAESTFNRLCGDNETEVACEQPTKWNVIYPIKGAAQPESNGADHEEL